MLGKYFVELKDKHRIITAEKIESNGAEPVVKLLKPRDDDVFWLERGDYNDFWLWLKDEKSFLPGETLDICFISSDEVSVKPLIESIRCIGVNVCEETEITLGDVKVFLQITERRFADAALSYEKTVLYLEGGEKLFAFNADGKGLKADPENFVDKLSVSVTKKTVRQRPKAFKTIPLPTKENASPSIAFPKEKKEQTLIQSVAPQSSYSNNKIPKATAADIQIGIKRITEDQCQDVDFRS